MLPSADDCLKRTFAKQFPDMVGERGYQLRKLQPSVGAAVGTAVHAAAEHLLRGKQETGELPPIDEAIAPAAAKFREEIAPGAEWDDTTPNLQVAEFQIRRLTEAYLPIAQQVNPAGIELALLAKVAAGWELSGHIDLYTREQRVDDLKTGAVRRPYQAQVGAYALLLEANGHPVSSVGVTWIPRGKKTKPQPPAECETYDLDTSKRAAFAAITRFRQSAESFIESGDPFSLPANPMSLMCSRRYCGAWGTPFCRLHLERGNDHGSND